MKPTWSLSAKESLGDQPKSNLRTKFSRIFFFCSCNIYLLSALSGNVYLTRIINCHRRISSQISQLSERSHKYPIPTVCHLNSVFDCLLFRDIRSEPKAV